MAELKDLLVTGQAKVNQLAMDAVSGTSSLAPASHTHNYATSFNGNTGDIVYDPPVKSLNGMTGAVTLPNGVTSVQGLTGDVEVVGSFNGNTGAVTYTAPVTSVNGATGAPTGYETTAHLVTAPNLLSTDEQYPSAKWVYENVASQEQPLYIEMLEDGYVGFVIEGSLPTKALSYSLDKIHWTTTTLQAISGTGNLISVSNGQKIYFKSNNTSVIYREEDDPEYACVKVVKTNNVSGTNASFNVGGTLASLWNYTAGITAWFFAGTKVINAKALDVAINNTACVCQSMFELCTSLVTAPVLYAQTLAAYAYLSMFGGCTALTKAPDLPSQTLATSCYANMFDGCTNLLAMPVISATVLANYCCNYMFRGCTSLSSVTPLVAQILTPSCYQGMFQNCTALKQLPLLPSTSLANSCYKSMFSGCSNIKLSATQTVPYLNLYKVPSAPLFNYDTTWKNSLVSQGDYIWTWGNSLTMSWSGTPVRYIRDSTNGSNKNTSNHWNEIQATNADNTNVCLGLPVVGSNGTTYTNSVATDGVINASYIDLGTGTKYVTVDLGSTMLLTAVKIWHYYSDSRIYNDNVTSISTDGDVWTTIYSGTHTETSGGNVIDISSGGVTETVIDTSVTSFSFSSNNTSYVGMSVDADGNMFYIDSNDIATKVYDATDGWVDVAYKELSALTAWEGAFTEPWATFMHLNGSQTNPWGPRGQALTMNFKSNSTDYTSFNVDADGNILYNTTPVYYEGYGWIDSGYLYDRQGMWYLGNMPTFTDVYKVIIYYRDRTGIYFQWEGAPSTIYGTNGGPVINGVQVMSSGPGICNWQVWSYNSNTGTNGYTTKTALTTTYKTIRTTFHSSQKFTGATTWLPFYTENMSSVTQSTITVPTNAFTDMFKSTGGSFTGTPTLNKAYFTDATIVPDGYNQYT